MKNIICVLLLWIGVGSGLAHAQYTRPLSDFTQLEVTDKINITLVPSDRDYLEIHGNLADKFELVQQDQVVRIKMALGYQLQGSDLYITVYYTDLMQVTARKGATISNENHTLTADSIYLAAHEGSTIALRIDTDRLGVNSTTGGKVQLIGAATSQHAHISLGGFYYAQQLSSNNATLTVTGGGRAEIYARESANLQTRAGGIIDVYGNPKRTKERKFAGGRITYIN